ncbi:hypothetical protein [Pararhizobium sp. DWP1-1-3]|uniref:hypothetical protein n=1 Tax=Pararhizobium sp. DWP1-1-3 TaxID=2804652 RepID=UPI003CF6F9C2
MTQLTLCMPSNRNLQHSASAIETALIYADKRDCRLVVSDNSGDPQKRARYENSHPRLTYVVPDGDGGLQNMASALSKVETPFLMPMGDDDEIYGLDDKQPLDLSALPGDVIGVRPQTFIWTNEKGVQQVDRFAITAGDAGGRLLEYNGKANGNNGLYYSMYRSDLFKGLFSLFSDAHPTHGGYCDWALSFAFSAAGKFLTDTSTIYRYDLGRWASSSKLEAAKTSLYLQAGLPDTAEHFSALLRFIDVHVFLISLPLPDAERRTAQMANARLALRTFLHEVTKTPDQYDPEVVYLAELTGQTPDLDTAFQISLLIIDRLQEGLAEKYVRFMKAAGGAV